MNIQSLINFVPSLGRTGVSIEIKELSVFVFVDRNGLRLGLRLCCSCFFLIFDYFYVSMVKWYHVGLLIPYSWFESRWKRN